jgi:hypothetical protein
VLQHGMLAEVSGLNQGVQEDAADVDEVFHVAEVIGSGRESHAETSDWLHVGGIHG